MFRVIQISDTHLTRGDARAIPGWNAALDHFARSAPHLVIHTGDIANDPTSREERAFAMAELGRIGAPLRVVAGNHDVGDTPPAPLSVTPEQLRQHEAAYGPSRWAEDIPGWRIIGINTQLLGTGLPAERNEWDFLTETLGGAGERDIAVFMHKPPFVFHPAEPQQTTAAVPIAARRRLWEQLKRARVRLVSTGHRHEYRVTHHDGIAVVWCPATALIPETTPPLAGSPLPALIDFVFAPGSVAHTYVGLSHDR